MFPRLITGFCPARELSALLAASQLLCFVSHGSDWEAGEGYRHARLSVTRSGETGFSRLEPAQTGLVFTNHLDELAGAANRVLYNGAGVAVGDIDHDDLPDIFLCDLGGANALFKNLGNWRFTNITSAAGLGTMLPATRGAVFADVTGDGHLDLLVTVNGRGAFCSVGDGKGKFRGLESINGAAGRLGSTSMALADVDGNGTLDLYVVNYRPDDIRDRGRVNISMVNGRPVMAGGERNRFVMLNGRLEECGQPDQLLLNDGAGRFQPVSWTNGTFLDENAKPLSEPPADWGLTAAFHDVNGDGAPDLYVCNDYWTPDRFWINDGKGRFRLAGSSVQRKTSASSMSLDFSDIDRDGFVDFFVVDMLSRYPEYRKRQSYAQMLRQSPIGAIDLRPQVMRNTLFLNRQDGTFAEIACFAGLPASDWSWAPIFVDVDLDGYEDLLIGAGHFRDVQDYDAEAIVKSRQHSWQGFKTEAERQKAFTAELLEHFRLYPLLQMPVGAFRNRGDCTFAEVTSDWGLNHPGIHQGLIAADLDLDGDLDLVINELNRGAMLFRNDGPQARVSVRLKGRLPNREGIGARITLVGGAIRRQSAEITAGGHYQSGAPAAATFGAGSATDGMSLEVAWRDGTRSLVQGVQPNRLYEIEQTTGAGSSRSEPDKVHPLFEDVSHRIAHEHHETEFNDYERQPLLPFKLSQMGPGIGWYDLSGDGREELVVGAGAGGAVTVYNLATREPDGGAGVVSGGSPVGRLVVSNDAAGLVGYADGRGRRGLLMGVSGYEARSTRGADQVWYEGTNFVGGSPVGREMSGGGALALGDMNGTGQLALFVGGGVSPGSYPLGAPSKLYRFDGRQWVLDARNSLLLENIGIINGAVWSDLDEDGRAELVLACEWGPLRVYRSEGGGLIDVTERVGLKPFTGWWRGVTTGDFNGDGKLDIVASNWGLNSYYRATQPQPLVFGYGQITQPGVVDVVETEYVSGRLAPCRQFADLLGAMPFLHERFNSHHAYSEASLDEVLGDRKVLMRTVSATTLECMLFLNTGKAFAAARLPREAQFAPAFSVNVADFNGDGNEDVFLSQSFFAVRPETTRIDAGTGLCLLGDGAGGLAAMTVPRSGICALGEQRGAAVGDFDGDGRVDLAIAQNGASTKLYRNTGANRGLRVRLKGPPGNPDGLNAVLRLSFGGRLGPAREIHGGSGYWSQDSVVQVMAMPAQPSDLLVRWPGGARTTTAIPPGSFEITVDVSGNLVAP